MHRVLPGAGAGMAGCAVPATTERERRAPRWRTWLATVGLACAACHAGAPLASGRARPQLAQPAESRAATSVAAPESSAAVPAPASTAEPSAPSAAPPPVYDLTADLAARQLAAVRELGPRTDTEVVEGTFMIASRGGRAALAHALDVSRRALAAYFNGRFTRRPERAVSVYLFPDATPYEAYCQERWRAPCIAHFGFYLHEERLIVMNVGPGIGTLTHELVHPLVAVDFPEAPSWLNEGIASLFEQFYFSSPAEIHGGKNWRHPRLVQALRSSTERSAASLPALFALSDSQFRGEREALNYATARYFCQWLDQRGQLWPFYQRWRDHFREDPSGEQSVRAILGKTPEEADAEWRAWVLRL